MGGVRPSVIVEAHPGFDAPARIAAAGEGVQVDALVFQRPPEALDEDVVKEAPAPIHRDAHAGILKALRPGPGGELASLIGVEDLRRPVALQRFLQGVDAELCLHGVGEPPRQHLAACPPEPDEGP